MNPKKISAFIILVLMALLALTFFSRTLAIKAGLEEEGFDLGFTELKYPKFGSFMRGAERMEPKRDIDSIVKNIAPILDEVEEEAKDTPLGKTVQDFIREMDFSAIDTTKIVRIHYPENKVGYLNTLRTYLNSNSCRIVHYGDSQLEGDRISAYVRNRLQGMYGGSGPGFIPIKQAYEQISASVTPSEEWLRYAAFDRRQEMLDPASYGIYTSISRFHPYINPNDTTQVFEPSLQKVSIRISPSKKLYRRLGEYSKIGLHYGNCIAPTSVKIYLEGTLIKEEALINDGQYHEFQLDFETTPEEVLLELEGTISPNFYGLTLDGKEGISLDNVAMRGASGTIFVKLDRSSFDEMAKNLNPKIFIFQYGGNTVPYLKTKESVDSYVNYVRSNVNWVRRHNPEVLVIFVGPSDMATSVNGSWTTYPLLPYLDRKLKEMCSANNMAYWSMYEAMGGENAMPYWVEQEWAGSDYTHFTAKGNRIISELFFTALQLDLKNN